MKKVIIGGSKENTAVSVELGDIGQPDTFAQFRSGHELMNELVADRKPSRFAAEGLCNVGVCLLVAKYKEIPVGCCAVFWHRNYGELKKMYVSPDARRKGVAGRLLRRAEKQVSDRGYETLKLESAAVLHKAHDFYQQNGFSRCGAFGGHKDDPRSIFMKKLL